MFLGWDNNLRKYVCITCSHKRSVILIVIYKSLDLNRICVSGRFTKDSKLNTLCILQSVPLFSFYRKKPPAGPLEERLILIIFRTNDHPLKVLTKSFITGGSVSSAETFSDVCSSSLKRRIFSTHISSRGFVFSPATTVIKNTFSRICLVKWQLH